MVDYKQQVTEFLFGQSSLTRSEIKRLMILECCLREIIIYRKTCCWGCGSPLLATDRSSGTLNRFLVIQIRNMVAVFV